ncbi:hypothetical protein MPSEU_000156400 [Mayamaea pseudoterrestris]|nr:hypothetical protein MPSEU_000156400 [Mayamaea pseudoterrestris]
MTTRDISDNATKAESAAAAAVEGISSSSNRIHNDSPRRNQRKMLQFHHDRLDATIPLLSLVEPSVIHLASLEILIEQAFVDDDDAFYHPVNIDASLLNCARPKYTKAKPSLFGLVEEGVDQVSLQVWEHDINYSNAVEQREEATPLLQHREWRRMQHHGASSSSTLSHESAATSNAAVLMDWIDLRSAEAPMQQIIETPADVLVFLRSLLGTRHTASPWYDDETASIPNTIVLIIHQAAPEILVNFRVGDANPSWYLHSVLRCRNSLLLRRPWEDRQQQDQQEGIQCLNDNDANDGTCTLLVYRHLPPRKTHSLLHPVTKQVAPSGTLWETVPNPKATANATKNESTCIPPVLTRLTCQPYLNALEEFPYLQLLIDNLPIIQKEASMVQHWTAWPETTHYSNDNDSATPWTVFPLCHCFPATDESKLAWIPSTTSLLPQTTALLQQLRAHVRTALLSRLAPQALLQAHTGWQDLANYVVRVHLPLLLPATKNVCGLWVDGCVQTLRHAELVAFDDSKVHWAFNYSPSCERVVLILDVVRPRDLPMGTAVGGHSEELDSFIASMG